MLQLRRRLARPVPRTGRVKRLRLLEAAVRQPGRPIEASPAEVAVVVVEPKARPLPHTIKTSRPRCYSALIADLEAEFSAPCTPPRMRIAS
mgnify:CR=1 FL=1